MIKSNKTLKEDLDNYNGRFEETNEKYRNNKEQKEMLKKFMKNQKMKWWKEKKKMKSYMDLCMEDSSKIKKQYKKIKTF